MSEKNIPQSIYHICAAVMCLCISAFILIGAIQMKETGEAMGTYFGELSAYQQELRQQATAGSEILSEVLAYSTARGLEEAQMLSPSEANEIVSDSIKSISTKSERWGKLARAIDNAVLNARPNYQ